MNRDYFDRRLLEEEKHLSKVLESIALKGDGSKPYRVPAMRLLPRQLRNQSTQTERVTKREKESHATLRKAIAASAPSWEKMVHEQLITDLRSLLEAKESESLAMQEELQGLTASRRKMMSIVSSMEALFEDNGRSHLAAAAVDDCRRLLHSLREELLDSHSHPHPLTSSPLPSPPRSEGVSLKGMISPTLTSSSSSSFSTSPTVPPPAAVNGKTRRPSMVSILRTQPDSDDEDSSQGILSQPSRRPFSGAPVCQRASVLAISSAKRAATAPLTTAAVQDNRAVEEAVVQSSTPTNVPPPPPPPPRQQR
eukprot:scaffold2205_cov183-Ochromonas_danica.AAC.25